MTRTEENENIFGVNTRVYLLNKSTWWVEGSDGCDTGVQSYERITLSASKKFLNKEATKRSCRNNFWNNVLGNVFHAIVSVIAVKIQFNSPNIVRRSPNWPNNIHLLYEVKFDFKDHNSQYIIQSQDNTSFFSLQTWYFVKHF